MRRRRLVFVAALLLLTGLAFRVALRRPLALVGAPPRDGFHRLSGVVHVHTTESDGSGTPEEVVGAARRAGLGFVAITDHNTLAAKPIEGYRDRVLVMVGTEISTTDGHIVALGLTAPPFRFSGEGRDALDDVRHLGGVAFAAHPESPREDFRWTGDALPGPWGFEILNGDSAARRAGRWRLARAALLTPLNPRDALLGTLTPFRAALARWDGLLQQRPVPAVAGADAHARIPIRKTLALHWPSYRAVFSVARTHVLLERPPTGGFEEDARAVVEALARGRSYVGIDGLAPAGEVAFVVDGSRRWTMGDTVPWEDGLRVRSGGRAPSGTRFVLLRDGSEIAVGAGSLDLPVEVPGVYRIEAHVPGFGVPWVVTNAIAVVDPATAAERTRRAAWPQPAPAPVAAVILDDFEGKTVFEPASDALSALERPVLDPAGGREGGGAARLRFRLATEGASPFVGLVHQARHDLGGRTGLVLDVRGDGPARVWVQVRDENPASAEEGTEWWFASIRASPEWRRVAIPFARLRSIDPRTDGKLDLDKVRAIVFVIDKGAMPLGAEGTVWLDNVGVY